MALVCHTPASFTLRFTVCPLKASCTVEHMLTSLVSIHFTNRSLSFLIHCRSPLSAFLGKSLPSACGKPTRFFLMVPQHPMFFFLTNPERGQGWSRNCPHTVCSPHQAEETAEGPSPMCSLDPGLLLTHSFQSTQKSSRCKLLRSLQAQTICTPTLSACPSCTVSCWCGPWMPPSFHQWRCSGMARNVLCRQSWFQCTGAWFWRVCHTQPCSSCAHSLHPLLGCSGAATTRWLQSGPVSSFHWGRQSYMAIAFSSNPLCDGHSQGPRK